MTDTSVVERELPLLRIRDVKWGSPGYPSRMVPLVTTGYRLGKLRPYRRIVPARVADEPSGPLSGAGRAYPSLGGWAVLQGLIGLEENVTEGRAPRRPLRSRRVIFASPESSYVSGIERAFFVEDDTVLIDRGCRQGFGEFAQLRRREPG